MERVFLGNTGLSIIIPFKGREKPKTFNNLSQREVDRFVCAIDTTMKQTKLSSRRTSLYELTNELYKSDDLSSRFLASQISMVLSGPELVRKKLMKGEGNVSDDILEKENKSLEKLKTYYLRKDLPAIFSTNADLYYTYLLKLNKPCDNFDRVTFIKEMETAGKSLSKKKYQLKDIYDFFEKYCNKALDLPIETYLINYLYHLFCEFAYEKESLPFATFEEFCKYSGKCFLSLAKALKDQNYIKTFNLLFDYSEYVNKSQLTYT